MGAEDILECIKEKARVIKTVDILLSFTQGELRKSYKAVIENELFKMNRLIDDFKMEICGMLSDVEMNAIFVGSIFPNSAFGKE